MDVQVVRITGRGVYLTANAEMTLFCSRVQIFHEHDFVLRFVEEKLVDVRLS